MWDAIDFSVIGLTRLLYSCDFFKVNPPVVQTVIYMVDVILFCWVPYVGDIYMLLCCLSNLNPCRCFIIFWWRSLSFSRALVY